MRRSSQPLQSCPDNHWHEVSKERIYIDKQWQGTFCEAGMIYCLNVECLIKIIKKSLHGRNPVFHIFILFIVSWSLPFFLLLVISSINNAWIIVSYETALLSFASCLLLQFSIVFSLPVLLSVAGCTPESKVIRGRVRSVSHPAGHRIRTIVMSVRTAVHFLCVVLF